MPHGELLAIEKHSRLEMGRHQLETAVALYFENRDVYSVITLAGAADELFGKALKFQGQESRVEELSRSVAAIHKRLYGKELDPKKVAERANHARNSLKHWSLDQPVDVEFDLVEESKDMLERGINNFWALYGDLTEPMERFEREVLRRHNKAVKTDAHGRPRTACASVLGRRSLLR
jgi:hypothetical protein